MRVCLDNTVDSSGVTSLRGSAGGMYPLTLCLLLITNAQWRTQEGSQKAENSQTVFCCFFLRIEKPWSFYRVEKVRGGGTLWHWRSKTLLWVGPKIVSNKTHICKWPFPFPIQSVWVACTRFMVESHRIGVAPETNPKPFILTVHCRSRPNVANARATSQSNIGRVYAQTPLIRFVVDSSFTTNPRQIHNKSNKWSLGNTKHGHVPIRTYPFMNITNNFSEFQ